MKPFLILLTISLLTSATMMGAGLSPWQFGMSPAQVSSFKEFGPYKSFSNGDLETFNGSFHGLKRNIQFYFRHDRLVRIAVSFGEGSDRNKAVAACQELYEFLQHQYGPVTISEEKSENAKAIPPAAHALAATVNAELFGNSHIVPVKQPKDLRVSGNIRSAVLGGQKWFYVGVNFDERT